MAQINMLQSLSGTICPGEFCASLKDLIMSVSSEDRPLTLRQVANLGLYDIDTVTAALREHTQCGALATFKIGPLKYYASPQTALTAKGPTLTSFANEVVRNALWEGKRRVKSMTERVFDSVGR